MPTSCRHRRSTRARSTGRTGEDAFFPHGYDRVPEYLARHLDVDFGVVVRRVVLRPRGVRVETSAGSIQARAVVVTVPLGVLKREGIEFVPRLPERHEQAIDRLGMGVLSKTFLRFDKPFWPSNLDWQEYLGPRPGAWAEWFSMAKAGPPVLVAFHGGDRARELERADARDVRGDAMRMLRTMFGHDIPAPLAITTTGWSRDRFALRLLLHERSRLDARRPGRPRRTSGRPAVLRRRGDRARLQLDRARRLPDGPPGRQPGPCGDGAIVHDGNVDGSPSEGQKCRGLSGSASELGIADGGPAVLQVARELAHERLVLNLELQVVPAAAAASVDVELVAAPGRQVHSLGLPRPIGAGQGDGRRSVR